MSVSRKAPGGAGVPARPRARGGAGGRVNARPGRLEKRRLRIRLFHRLKTQKEEDRRRKSEAIRRKLFRLAVFRKAKTVLCYVSLSYEVETWLLMKQMLEIGKRVVVPRVHGRDLRLSEVRDLGRDLAPGAFGVWEPTPKTIRPVHPDELDLVLVPGVAFDRSGQRLGHGQGYFDRFLSRLPRTTPRVGLCFEFQLLDRLPVSSHDQTVQTVLSA